MIVLFSHPYRRRFAQKDATFCTCSLFARSFLDSCWQKKLHLLESCQSVSDAQHLHSLSPSAGAASPRSPDGGCCVGNALCAFPTQHPPSGERRRREHASVLGIRHILRNEGDLPVAEMTRRG